ncbi:MAG: hypothetical protein IJC49_00240 [Clostridia bacterium]|nr:hypothetical protein [Clostridia bacterium]
MTEKDLKKLSRIELLEMLIEQTEENQELTAHIRVLQQKLDDRRIMIDESGSIAEASLKLNGIFDAAQAAADEYLENVRRNSARQENLVEKAEALAREKVTQMIAEADERCRRMEDETARKCDAMTMKARREADSYWAQVSSKLNAYLKQHSDLKNLLTRDFPAVGSSNYSMDD